ncbi:MAG: DUF2089 family protein [Bdellovibrionota bacterium]
MKTVASNIQCPSCQKVLRPKHLVCDGCEIQVDGRFELNEFATLPQEELHFLRIFVRCEGRIKEMESALGLSYPTIRARLTALKTKLAGPVDEGAAADSKKVSTTSEVLKRLEAGEISFEEAMKTIKKGS